MILKGGRNKQSTTKHNKASQSLTAQEPPHKKTNIPFEMFAHVYAIPAHPTNRRRYARTCAAPVSFRKKIRDRDIYVQYVRISLRSSLSLQYPLLFFRTFLFVLFLPYRSSVLSLPKFPPSKIFLN